MGLSASLSLKHSHPAKLCPPVHPSLQGQDTGVSKLLIFPEQSASLLSQAPVCAPRTQCDGCEDIHVLPGYPSTKVLSCLLFWALDTSVQHTMEEFQSRNLPFWAVSLPQCLIVPRKGDNQRIVLASISHCSGALGELGPL